MKPSHYSLGHAGVLLRRALRIALLGVLAMALGSCGSGGSSSSGTAQMRVFNAIFQGGAATVTVGTGTAATSLGYEGLTTYVSVPAGAQELKVTLAGATSPSIDVTNTLTGGANYSYILWGTAATPAGLLVSDATVALTTGQFGVRVTNAAFGSAGLDVYLTAPGASIDTASPNIGNVLISTTSGYAALTAGSFQVRFTLHNSKQVIYDAGTIAFASGSWYYFVAYTKGSGTLVNAALLKMDSTGSGALSNSQNAQFKLIHAAPLTAAINAMVNGVVAFANVPYQGVTSYATEASGTQTLTIETVTSPGAVIASAQPPFGPATDTSAVVTGLPGSQSLLLLNDNNLPGTVGSARVRFVNVAPNLGAVDVLVNFATKVSALGTSSASGYVELVEDTYTINFDLAGTTTAVLTLPSVALVAGRTYSLYLMGTSGQLAGVLTRDD